MKKYLEAGEYINSNHKDIIRFVEVNTDKKKSVKENLISLYYKVRDGWRYDPYKLDFSVEGLKASDLFKRSYGYCIEKASLFAASARAIGVPSRMGFANVRNHIATDKYTEILGTDILVFHGYAEVFINDKWIKATPAFNKELCHYLNVSPLEFDGEEDSILQEYDKNGNTCMEYLKDHGTFTDIPRAQLLKELSTHYPDFFGSDRMEKEGISVTL